MADAAQRERIESEASIWAARLRGRSLTDADRAALAEWLDADPEHRWVLGRYRELSAQLDVQLGPAVESLAVMRAATRRRRLRAVGASLAAAAAVIISVAIWQNRSREFVTQTAERHVATLADGSRVELNARTELAVDFRRDERRVRLVHGEALFSVARDAARPFVVETPSGVVRVTGTVFNVRTSRSANVEVTVLEGTVRLRAANEAVADEAVTSGRQAVMSAGEITLHTLPEGAAQDVVAWRTGQAIFEDVALGEVMERFAAYHARAITVDADVAELRIGGRYHLDDLEGLLKAVERVLPVRCVRGANGEVRIVAGPSRGR